jgi:NADH-quinone oxidoreductase subunit I
MDHDYEIASIERMQHHAYDLEKLAKPVSYYASIRPANFKAEEDAKAAKAAAKQTSQVV